MLDLGANINESREGNERICSNLTFVIRRAHNQQPLDCLVLNELNESSSVMLNVLYSPVVKMDLAISSRGYFSFSLTLTRNGSLRCTAEGNPQPLVTLEKQLFDGNWREVSVDFHNVSNTTSTAVRSFSLQNMSNGLYRCSANNGVGPTQVSEEINIDRKFVLLDK
ncbi:hypothetical protein HOLleu_05844 [Holothuria leucospilota]|uniref:Ig-like domain-containing protein n=1 Tax=Holothuria leucospilota TaxID=206669 RepID=A0A9Q1CK41_HOLLE|nr:hypothetical protein HOLleu_05844 [Holothuria leucospilota]